MTVDQLVRNILERAIAEGLVLPATGRFADPDPQKPTYDEVKDLVALVLRWQQGRVVWVEGFASNIRYD